MGKRMARMHFKSGIFFYLYVDLSLMLIFLWSNTDAVVAKNLQIRNIKNAKQQQVDVLVKPIKKITRIKLITKQAKLNNNRVANSIYFEPQNNNKVNGKLHKLHNRQIVLLDRQLLVPVSVYYPSSVAEITRQPIFTFDQNYYQSDHSAST